MSEPSVRDSFTINYKQIGVEWFDLHSTQTLPAVKWQQVYAIGNLNGKVPLVLYETGSTNLPGGKIEPGEDVEAGLNREIEEELNCRVLSWHPIGYQRLDEPDNDDSVYQLRVYAELEKIGEFENDPGGSVVGYQLVDFSDLNKQINYGRVGDRIMQLVLDKFA